MNNMYYYFGYINISFDKRIIKIYVRCNYRLLLTNIIINNHKYNVIKKGKLRKNNVIHS